MEQPNRFWYVKNPYAWVILIMGIVTAFLIREFWVILVGVIGFELALLVDLTRGQSLGRSGRVRLARLEQEYRELKAEQTRLIGAIEERDRKLAGLPGQPAEEGRALEEPADRAVEEEPLQEADLEGGGTPTGASPAPVDPIG
jgi:hypothetical protein